MKVQLANYGDMVEAEKGLITKDEVRSVEIEGWVDTGASRLVIPQWVADKLGCPLVGRSKATLADQSVVEREVLRYVWLKLLGREGIFSAMVEPNRDDALLGAIVLEELDMVADCVTGTCYPRDPNILTAVIE